MGDLGIGVRLIVKLILKKIRCKGVDWIQLTQNRVQWWALLIVNLHI
jgi:hypothetical protein